MITNARVRKNFFIESSLNVESAVSHALFYQQVKLQIGENEARGRALSNIVEHLYLIRDHDTARRVANELRQSPLASLRASGCYFEGLLAQGFDLGKAESLLMQAAENTASPPMIIARSYLALGSVAWYKSDSHAEREYYNEGLRYLRSTSMDVFTFLETQRALAIDESSKGNHIGAAEILQETIKAADVCNAHPVIRCDHRNSLAVELYEMGRLDEAEHLSQTILATSFSKSFPEWRATFLETQAEIEKRDRRRSTVYFSSLQADESDKPQVQEDQKDISSEVEPGGALLAISEYLEKRNPGISKDFKRRRAFIIELLYKYAERFSIKTLDQIISELSREI